MEAIGAGPACGGAGCSAGCGVGSRAAGEDVADRGAPSEDEFKQELAALLAAAVEVLEAVPPKLKRRRRAAGADAAQPDTLHRVEVEYSSVGTTVRAF